MTLQALVLVQSNPTSADPLIRALTIRGIHVTTVPATALPPHSPAANAQIVLLDFRLQPGATRECVTHVSGWGMPTMLLMNQANVGAILDGLDAGADDFIVAPFSPDGLTVRMAVLVKKRHSGPLHILQAMDLTMDLQRRSVHRGTRELQLSRREFDVLKCLLRNKGVCISRDILAEGAGLSGERAAESAIKVYICNLRSKLCAKGEADIIESRRGYGYLLHAG